MKSVILLIIVCGLLAVSTLAQQETGQEKDISLSATAIKKRIIKQDFSSIPQDIRDCHAQGSFYLRVKVDQKGKVKSVNLISGLCQKADDYLKTAVASWKFKPLEVNKKKASFVGIVAIPFCYGGFGSCY